MDEISVLINEFVSPDRDIFKTPWLSKDNIIATNGKILLCLPVNIIGGISYPGWIHNVSEPDVATSIFSPSAYAPVEIREIADIVSNTVLLCDDDVDNISESCEDCGGDGKHECPTCGDGEVKCETCSGTGRVIALIDVSKRGTKTEYLTTVKVRDVTVDCHLLKKLLEVMEYFAGEIWEVSVIGKNSPILFKNSSGAKMAIMPVCISGPFRAPTIKR